MTNKMMTIEDQNSAPAPFQNSTPLEAKKAMAEQMIRSGLLPATVATISELEDEESRDKAIGAVIALVEYGNEINIGPWVALHNMHVVSGKVVMGIHMYTGLALKHGIMIDIVEDYVKVYATNPATGAILVDSTGKGTLTDVRTTVEITRAYSQFGGMVKTHRFSKNWSEIKKAGLHERDNYVKRPTTMLRTRCITEALRIYAADIFMGTYETSEMLDISDQSYTVDDEGNATIIED
jgi:hypothetical protein